MFKKLKCQDRIKNPEIIKRPWKTQGKKCEQPLK